MDGCKAESLPKDEKSCNSSVVSEEMERNARVDSIWQQMNKGVSAKSLNSLLEKRGSTISKTPEKRSVQESSAGWMNFLGLGSKKKPSPSHGVIEKQSVLTKDVTVDVTKRLAADALSAIRDAAALTGAAALSGAGRGKVEISELRDFAGEEIEVKKFVHAESTEAADVIKDASGPVSAVDALLDQIKKKPKLSVLDKSKKDWNEFKDDNKGMEDELDAYKKSSNKYLDKVSFLQRADYREFERERDVRLASQSKRKADMRED